MPDPRDAPDSQGGPPPDPPAHDPGADADADDATWGGEGGAGSYRGPLLTNVPRPDREKKEG
jgi:hypothetical protein